MSEDATGPRPYDIQGDGEQALPTLWGAIAVRDTADDLLDVVAAELMIEAQTRIRASGEFHFAVGWTGTVVRFLERMMFDPVIRNFPWAQTHCWLLNDTRNDDCYVLLRDILVPHSGIDEAHLHGADDRDEGQAIDYAMLDVGENGRVGAIGSDAEANEVLVPTARINRAGFISLLAMGMGVRTRLDSLEPTSDGLPVQSIRSETGTTRWYLSGTTLDEDAEPFAG